MGSSAGQILSIAAPVALTFIAPYLAPELGAVLTGSTAAEVAAGTGALSAGATGALGGAALGAAVGAGTSALTGNSALTGALTGGVTGGIGGYVQGSGGLSNALGLGSSNIDAAGNAAGLAGTVGNAVDMSGGAGGVAGDAVDLSGNAGAGLLTSPAGGFANALSFGTSAAAPAASGWSSYVPSILGGTGANPSIGQVLGAGANLYSGIQGTAAAKANTAAEQQANNQALALQSKNYNATTANLSPYLTTGNQANAQLANDLGISGNTSASGYGSLTAPFTAADLENTPGYKFQLDQGTKALNQSLGAQGQLFSGAALKEGQQFATGLADSTYNTAYSQYLANQNQDFNMLSSTSGSGQNAATNQGGFAAGLSSLGTPTLQNTGNITAAGNNAGNTAINNSLASALSGSGVGGAQGSSYGTSSGMTPLPGGGYTMNGMTYNAQGVRIA